MNEATPLPPDAAREELLALLRAGAGRGQGGEARLRQLITTLEQATPADLAALGALQLLEGVWELRWSSSRQPYLAVGPWLENLQLLAPSQGRAMNLLRPPGPLASLGGIAVEAAIQVEPAPPHQRVAVRFRRGGWIGPQLGQPFGAARPELLRSVTQSFPAWLDITVLDQELRLCRGNAGTVFALVRRPDLSLDLLPRPVKGV
jgi:hypothetical protein